MYAVFLLSGAAGLVYQVVWSRLLNEVFGITAHAVTAVLATFLGGLALGSLVLGRVADRTRSPLRLYGLLEIGIGVAALAGTWVIRAFDPVHVRAATRFAPDSLALLAIRCALASVVILPPTMMMGATLPAITRVFVEDLAHVGRRLGLLYALNTAGAVAGSVLSGFVLIRALGVHATLWLAVAVNVLAGAVALALEARLRSGARPRTRAAATPAPTPAPSPETPGRRALLVAMAASGAASLALEVIWTRMLILVVGTSTYAFATMLSTFLVGIALGSLVARSFVDRLRDPQRTFGWVQLAIAASTVGSILLARLAIGWGAGAMDRLERDWFALLAGRYGIAFAVMLLPTTLIGMTFPLAARIRARSVRTLGGELGRLYGANTAGNIVGAVLGGFLLLPTLGMQRAMSSVVTLNVAAGAWALLAARRSSSRHARWRTAGVLACAGACCAALIAWQPGPLPGTGGGPTDPVVYYREGLVSTVKVTQRADDGRQLLMAVDGITIGQSSTGVDRKQQVLAHLPFLLTPDHPLRHVLSVGLGTGILVGEMARHPGVERVECVELSPSVIEGARLFARFNGDALANPAVRVVEDDGVHYLRRSRDRYDAIVSDGKSRSGHSGNAAFYSLDYYRSARDHLAPGGVMLQWVPLDVTPEDLRTIVRTFSGVFGHVFVWIGPESSFLVGQDRPLVLDLGHVQRMLDRPEMEHLRRHGWTNAEDVAMLLVADRPALASWLSGEDTVNSLEHPVLEFHALGAVAEPAPVRTARNALALARAGRGGLRDVTLIGPDPLELATARRATADFAEGYAAMALGEPRGWSSLRRALAAAPPGGEIEQWGALVVFGVGRDLDLQGDHARAIELYREAVRAWPEFPEAHINLARAYALGGWQDLALAEYREALRANPESATAHRGAGELLRARGAVEEALAHFRELVRISPDDAPARDALGLALALTGRFAEALAAFRAAAALDPQWPVPLDRAALVLVSLPGASRDDVAEAIALARRALALTHGPDPMALETLAAAYAAGGRSQEAIAAERDALSAARAAGDPALLAQVSATLRVYEHGGRIAPLAAPAAAPAARR